MSLYKNKRSPFWWYDFQISGSRFYGSTGETSRAKAERVEKRERAKAYAKAPDTKGRMRLDAACEKFIEEVAQFQASQETTQYLLADVTLGMGEATWLHEITAAKLAQHITTERGRIGRHGKLISNRTINHQLKKLRTLINRARKIWKVRTPEIEWSDLLLPVGEERVRAATPDEERRLLAELPADYRAVVLFAIATGLRRENVVGLTWADVDRQPGKIMIKTKSALPDRKWHRVPITRQIRAILSTRKGHHKTRVFTYEARRTDKGNSRRSGRVRGQRYIITPAGLRAALDLAAKRAGVQDFTFHDTRHTGATRLLGATGNLRMVQRLLGHSSIQTTAKYAHVFDDELAAGMELAAAGQSESPGPVPDTTTPDHRKASTRKG